ncbi:MAG: hypothetical protein H7144_15800 [Burkholderiales bacterium]|nr:hypothetical protein [Phycisphaerae bacterium]
MCEEIDSDEKQFILIRKARESRSQGKAFYMRRIHPALLPALLLLLLLTGCNFIGGFDARSREHLTSLKAYHIKVIDDVTSDSGKPYDKAKFETAVDGGELRFREAEEYAKSLKDGLRTSNIELLHGIYGDDVGNIGSKDKINPTQAETMKGPTTRAYDRAIAGEDLRKTDSDK